MENFASREERVGRDAMILALGHVSIFLASMLIGGMAGGIAVEAYCAISMGGDWLYPPAKIREIALNGLLVGVVSGLPFTVALQALDLKGRGPATWWGWCVAGFVLGVVPSAALAWIPLGTSA